MSGWNSSLNGKNNNFHTHTQTKKVLKPAMEMEDESLTHLRNLMQSFCNQIQLKVISPAAAGDDFYYNSEEFVGNEDASSSDLAVLLKSTQHELKLARLREKQLETRLNQLQSEFEREVQSRKAIHDELMEIRGNIRVFLRPRPPTVVGLGEEEETIKLLPETGSVIHIPTERRFEFDACIDSQFTQADLFESQVAPFVVSVSCFNHQPPSSSSNVLYEHRPWMEKMLHWWHMGKLEVVRLIPWKAVKTILGFTQGRSNVRFNSPMRGRKSTRFTYLYSKYTMILCAIC